MTDRDRAIIAATCNGIGQKRKAGEALSKQDIDYLFVSGALMALDVANLQDGLDAERRSHAVTRQALADAESRLANSTASYEAVCADLREQIAKLTKEAP